VKHNSTHVPPRNSRPTWQKTSYANLIRYAASGKYFARIRVGGKLIRLQQHSEPQIQTLSRRARKVRCSGDFGLGLSLPGHRSDSKPPPRKRIWVRRVESEAGFPYK
jgi:hypothetical protein